MSLSTALNGKNNRIESFDIARGIGILLMVMGHADFGADFSKVIHTFHMPLFFFVSGYFYRPQKYAGYLEYLRHNTRTLLIPYLIFAVFFEILHVIYTGDFSIRYFLVSICSSNHNRIDVAGALWFLLCLFSAKVVYHALSVTIKNRKVLTAVIIIISLSASFLRKFDIIFPFALDSALSCLLLIHVGYLLYLYRDNIFVRRLFNMTWWMFIIVAVVFFVTAFANDPVNVRRNKYGVLPLYLISCYSGILLTMNISRLIEKGRDSISKAIRKVLSYWGRESLVFLILNELMLFIVGYGFKFAGLMTGESYWERGIIVICTMALLSLTALIVSRTPLRILFGKRLNAK